MPANFQSTTIFVTVLFHGKFVGNWSRQIGAIPCQAIKSIFLRFVECVLWDSILYTVGVRSTALLYTKKIICTASFEINWTTNRNSDSGMVE